MDDTDVVGCWRLPNPLSANFYCRVCEELHTLVGLGLWTRGMPMLELQPWTSTVIALRSQKIWMEDYGWVALRAMPANGPFTGTLEIGNKNAIILPSFTHVRRFTAHSTAFIMFQCICKKLCAHVYRHVPNMECTWNVALSSEAYVKFIVDQGWTFRYIFLLLTGKWSRKVGNS